MSTATDIARAPIGTRDRIVATLSGHDVRSPGVWLASIVGLSAVVRGLIGFRVQSPWILPDEIVYSELAKSIAGGHRPSIRGVPVFGWGEVYPTLIAPAWAIFANPEWAYHVALASNAVLMSLAAIPAYFLGRLFVSRRAALLVASMTVLVPSMSYTGVLMTENAFYPVFLLALYLIARVILRPTLASQALALLGLGLVAFTRIQGVALLAAYVGAVLIFAATAQPSLRAGYLRRFLPSVAVVVPLAFAPVVASIVRGDGIFGWLGARSGTFDEFRLREVPEWFAFLSADLVLYVAVAPIAATAVIVLRGLSRGAGTQDRLFAALASSTFLGMIASVSLVSASLDVDSVENVNERYVFYVVPLAFLGLALWIENGLPRPARAALPVVAACCVLPAFMPFARIEHNASFQSIALLPWIGLSSVGWTVHLLVAAFAAACGLLWLRCRRERVGRLWLVTATSMLLLGALAVGANADSSSQAARTIAGQSTWVDDALPAGATAAVVWNERLAESRRLDPLAPWIMVTEFFNKGVGDVYRLGTPTYYEAFLPTIPLRMLEDGSLEDERGRKLEARYVLVTCRTSVDGASVIAQSPGGALQLLELEGPVRVIGEHRCGGDRDHAAVAAATAATAAFESRNEGGNGKA